MLVLPPDYPPIAGPLVFLAGPIQGAPDWQTEAGRLLAALVPTLTIASPRRRYPPGAFDYAAQVDWETHHLHRAAADGVILFWLACEVTPTPGRSYAQTTRFELAEWKVRHEWGEALARRESSSRVRMVVGIEPGFSGERYVRRRFAQDCPAVPVVDTLAETCRLAALACATERGA